MTRPRRAWRCFLGGVLLHLPIAVGAAQAQLRASDPFVIGLSMSLTGDGESFGRPGLDGARLAVEEAMAEDPSLNIRLDVHDDRGDDAEARTVAERLVAGQALVVIGPSFSTASLAAGPVYAAANVASLPPTATSDAITRNATTFRVVFRNSDQGEMLALYLARVLGRDRANVVVVDSSYGVTLREGFEAAAARHGVATRFFSIPRDAAEPALDAVAAEIAQAPDNPVVLLTLDPEGARLIGRLRRLGLPGPYLGGDAFGDQSFAALLAAASPAEWRPGQASENVYGLAPVILDSANAETLAFARRFRARYGHEPVWMAVAGYDAARIAISAIRQVRAAAPPDIATARRMAVDHLLSLNEPSRALPALLGPVWFDRARARQQAIRVGQFHNGNFGSAPLQIVSVGAPTLEEINSGEVFEIGPSRFGRLQRVVYTGVFINEIPRLDIGRASFVADFYLWVRFAGGAGPGAADPTDINFPTMLAGQFDRARPSERRESLDGTQYWLWRVQGEFRNDFDLRRFPFDRQTLEIPFSNARAAVDRIVYVIDGRGDGARAIASPDAFRNITQWTFLDARDRRENLVTRSILGDPAHAAATGSRELSGFLVNVELQRQSLTTLAKMLIPLLVMALITFASLFFPPALVKEKVTVAITGALSGAVLLASINGQLGSVGYTVAVEYVFYVAFLLALLCIVSVLAVERLRGAGRAPAALRVEWGTRAAFALITVATVAVCLALAAR